MPFATRKRHNRKLSNRRKSKGNKTRKAKAKSSNKLATHAYVKKMIHGQLQNKLLNASSFNFVYPAANAAFYSANVWNLTPYTNATQGLGTLIQGTTEQDRLGNTIHPRYSKFNFIIAPAQYNVSTNSNPRPMEVRLMFLRNKSSPTVRPSSLGDLFQLGASTYGPAGTLVDMIAFINKDNWQVFGDYRYKVGNQQIITNVNATLTANSQAYSNNDFKLNVMRRMTLRKGIPKTIKFDDAAAIPDSAGLWAVLLFAPADGSTLVSTEAVLTATVEQEFAFETA